MDDRTLLELAAKADGRTWKWFGDTFCTLRNETTGLHMPWNPMQDDGDALRLAVKLGLYIEGKFTAHQSVSEFVELGELAAVRRAIVRAAAEIGRTK